MTIALTFLSLGLLLAVAAFTRERRLRLALQLILQRLLSLRRNPHDTDSCSGSVAGLGRPEPRL